MAFSFVKPNFNPNFRPSKLLLSAHAPPTPLKPFKFTKRRNSLRPKILRIVGPTNPFPPQKPLETQLISILPPETHDQEFPSGESGRSYSAVAGEGDKVEEFRSYESETAGNNGGVGGFFGGYFFKFGLYLIGAFLVQTVYAVWVLANQEDRNLDSSDSGKERFLLSKGLSSNLGSDSSNGVYLDESQLEENIEEIRAMAKQARKVEKNGYLKDSGSKNGGFDKNLNSRNRIGIEKEIKTRLLKLQKSLNSDKEKLPVSYVSYLSNAGKKVGDEVTKAGSDERKGNENLMFKKKLMFRSPLTAEPSKRPKGFGDSGKYEVSKGKKSGFSEKIVEIGSVRNDDMELSEKEKEEFQVERYLTQNVWNKWDKGTRRGDGGKEVSQGRKPRNGVFRESKLGRPSVEVAKSRDLGTENGHLSLSRNGSSRHKVAEKKLASNKVQDRQSDSETDMWWLELPYVLGVLMHRGSDPEGPGGLYTLNPSTESLKQTDCSYTVAFEDRGDANNFCFLLESFFEDLGDVRADIVPLSIKELQAAVNSNNLKVIVVKKRQLQLYAGQPFADVEMALHSLVKEMKSAA
ncbi:ABC subfamily C protein [Parasponia andersonii]|uniref:ABC subfamily C protein n=1 Tax=Parasponia andersonii TaxID=3476 RepID=A0A2P5E4E4_PARAD|nr:ABC subfamily C protein [Parasponia andersonii]